MCSTNEPNRRRSTSPTRNAGSSVNAARRSLPVTVTSCLVGNDYVRFYPETLQRCKEADRRDRVFLGERDVNLAAGHGPVPTGASGAPLPCWRGHRPGGATAVPRGPAAGRGAGWRTWPAWPGSRSRRCPTSSTATSTCPPGPGPRSTRPSPQLDYRPNLAARNLRRGRSGHRRAGRPRAGGALLRRAGPARRRGRPRAWLDRADRPDRRRARPRAAGDGQLRHPAHRRAHPQPASRPASAELAARRDTTPDGAARRAGLRRSGRPRVDRQRRRRTDGCRSSARRSAAAGWPRSASSPGRPPAPPGCGAGIPRGGRGGRARASTRT